MSLIFRQALEEWNTAAKQAIESGTSRFVCKPCWEIKYCPYGPLVEQFPLPPIPRDDAIKHNEFLVQKMKEGAYNDDRKKKKSLQEQIDTFNPNDYPLKVSRKEKELSCSVFGHMCPVFLLGEPFTETPEFRKVSRNIPRKVMIRVVRRDNSTCQKCGRHLLDNEIHLDHKIPVTRGGPSTESNIYVLCEDCNKSKGNNIIFYD